MRVYAHAHAPQSGQMSSTFAPDELPGHMTSGHRGETSNAAFMNSLWPKIAEGAAACVVADWCVCVSESSRDNNYDLTRGL